MRSFPGQCQKLPENAAACVSLASHRWLPSLCYASKKGEKKKTNLIYQGIVWGPEHSCLTLVQSRKEARAVGWIKLSDKEEGEKSRKDCLCFRCSQVVGWMPEADVISFQLGWWVHCMSSENHVFVCVRVISFCLYLLSLNPLYVIRASAFFFLFFFISSTWQVFWLMVAR